MLAILIFQVLDKQRIKSLVVIIIVLPSIFMTSYQLSDLFKYRVDRVLVELTNYSDKQNSSVGLRVTFAINSWPIIKKKPLDWSWNRRFS